MRVRTPATTAANAADELLGTTQPPAQQSLAANVSGGASPPKGEMDFGELCFKLKKAGLDLLKLGHVSRWTLVQRLQAREWVEGNEQSPEDTREIPQFLFEYVGKTVGTLPPVESVPAPARTTVVDVKGEYPPAVTAALASQPGTREESLRQAPVNANVVDLAPGDPEPKPGVPLFATANKGPGINPDFARIVDTLYRVDAFREYEDLESNLEVGEQRGDRGTLREALDKAQKRARRAHQLMLGAKLERSNWERDSEVVNAAMRNTAHDELQEEKKDGTRNKAITDADVTSRVAERFADEWRAQETTRHKLKGVESSIEHLVKMWDSKVHSLSTLLETLR